MKKDRYKTEISRNTYASKSCWQGIKSNIP